LFKNESQRNNLSITDEVDLSLEKSRQSKPLITEQIYTFSINRGKKDQLEGNNKSQVRNISNRSSVKDVTGIKEFIDRDTFNNILKEVVADKFQATKEKLIPITDKSTIYPFKGISKGVDIKFSDNKVTRNPLLEDDESLNISRQSFNSIQVKEDAELLIKMDDIILISKSINEFSSGINN